MNKISIYILLILIYLGLSKSFAPLEKGTVYIPNERVFFDIFENSPISVILKENLETGFMIKSYYQKYLIVHSFKQPENITIRTTKEFWKKNQNNIGMSLFRRGDTPASLSSIPAPPGTLLIGDLSYGRWKTYKSGESYWEFYRAYKRFPLLYNWGDFKASRKFYLTLKNHIENNKIFYGLNSEFGTNGKIKIGKETDNSLKSKTSFNFSNHFLKFFTKVGQKRGFHE